MGYVRGGLIYVGECIFRKGLEFWEGGGGVLYYYLVIGLGGGGGGGGLGIWYVKGIGIDHDAVVFGLGPCDCVSRM